MTFRSQNGKPRAFNQKVGVTTLATVAAIAAFAPSAPAAECEGLACPSANIEAAAAHAPLAALTPAEVDATTASGFYDVGTRGEARTKQVAYIAAAGQWNDAPAELRERFGESLSATDRSERKIVIYGPGAIASHEAPKAKLTVGVPAESGVITPMAYSDCPSGWFCIFDGGSGTGDRYQWQSVGVWQGMGGAVNRASSMRNRRTGWSLLKRNDGRNYCARPISQDDSLANNGFNNNTSSTYNSASETQSSAWNCAN